MRPSMNILAHDFRPGCNYRNWTASRLTQRGRRDLRAEFFLGLSVADYSVLEMCLDEAVHAAAFSASIGDPVGKSTLLNNMLNEL